MKFKIQSSKFKIVAFLSLCCTAALLLLYCSSSSAELTINANHDHITIDFFYHGSTVSVSGISNQDVDLIVKITSPEGHQVMKEKGKVAGFLWMNIGTLNLEHVPNFYALHSTKKIEDILNKDEMEKYVIGYPALEKHVGMSPVANESDKTKWFEEFVKFKEDSKLYAMSSGKISFSHEGGKRKYYILTQWPYQAPPGEYLVTVYAVKDKKVIEKAETKVLVEQAGIVKALSGMAKNNSALYGIISIVAALGAGFGVGMIFRKGGGAH
jgi:uncharacterized protein (TIGR02186 family)